MVLRYRNEKVTRETESSILNTYGRQQISFVRGKGCTVWDSSGREYIDLVAGIAVNSLGYSHPRLVSAICNQANSVIHTSNLYEIDNQSVLASRLAAHAQSAGWKVFFSNSGAEANEAAIKFAFKATGRRKIVSMDNSFHGRTAMTLSVTGQRKYWSGFENLLYKDVEWAEYGSAESLREKIDSDTACVMVEPVQGEGGVIVPGKDYLTQVTEMARKNGTLVIMDEVQTGVGRTGRFFAHLWEEGCRPDIITMAKALAGGLPIGATLVSGSVASAIRQGDHGSTFGGNPLSTAAANAVLDVVESSGFMADVSRKGEMLVSGLRRVFEKAQYVHEVRGKGLMIGLDMDSKSAAGFKSFAFDRGFIVNVTHEHVVRLVPPLVIGVEEIESFLSMARAFASSYVHAEPASGH